MITFKKKLLIFVLMLFCGIACQAANDLITQQITIKLDEAGTLPGKIGSAKKYLITNLKIVGEINGTDLSMIRNMAGSDTRGNSTSGKLSILDLSEAKIIKGGDYYYGDYYNHITIKEDNVLGEYAFSGCTSLTSLTLPPSLTSIGDLAFNGCSSLTSLTLPSSLTSIGDFAFKSCSSLTSLTIPSSVTKIGDSTFDGCRNLKEVRYYINEDLTSYLQTEHLYFFRLLGAEFKYFLNNQEITNLNIPSSVTKIGGYAFSGCSGLTSLTIPSSVTEIERYAFYGCSGLTSLTIPSSVTEIESSAFSGCSGLTSLTIPSSVTEIERYAFYGCSGLTSLTIPSSVTKIESYAFYGCSGLTSLTIPSSVTKIESSAFSGCSGLTSLTIPSSVTEIGDYAFSGCTGLTSISIHRKTPLYVNSSVFQSVDTQKCTLYVPQGTYQDYWLADAWGSFENIVEFDVTKVDNSIVDKELEEISRHTTNGQRLDAPAKGINIVKYSDGSVRKVLVK